MQVCKCGRHVGLQPTMLATMMQAQSNEKILQCFLGGPTSYSVRDIKQSDAIQTRDFMDHRDLSLLVHASYLINLSRVGDESIIAKSRECLQKTVDNLAKIDSYRCSTVIHINGKGTIEKFCNELNSIDRKTWVMIENSAGEGSKLGKDMDEIRRIIEGSDDKIGVVIDTAHIHGAGNYDLSMQSGVETMFEDIDAFSDRRIIFHLNDSIAELGSKLDRHGIIGSGMIWNVNRPDSLLTLERMYEMSKMSGYDIIFETPNEFSQKFEQEMFARL